MDPNECLRRIRCFRTQLEAQGDSAEETYSQDTVDDLLEAIGDLDQWLKKGGFLPRDWQK
jgi:hypothetical protein